MRPSRRSLLRAALGISVSVVALWLVVSSVDLSRTADVLRAAAPGWIAVMLVLVLCDVGTRGLRWRRLLRPIRALPYRRVLGYTYIGYLANNVLPARLGELVRSQVLAEREALSLPTVLGTVVVERIVDTATVVTIAAIAAAVLSAQGGSSYAVVLGGGFVLVLVVGLALLLVADRLPGAARVAAFLERWPRVLDAGRRLRDGLAVVGDPRTLAAAIGLGLVAWSASIGTFLAAGRAVGVEVVPLQAALLCTGVALATIVPSGPGYLGTFEFTAVGIAATFGIDRDSAFAMALLVHAMLLVVTSVGGVIAVVRLGPRPAAATESAPSGPRPAGT
ncbi:MAG: lysylphosphatidylglycerol synthase transmembrane domain-containing protein [Chloroflexota bacterium]